MIGWIGDFFRFWWGLLYWNARKSLFWLRPDRIRCPCQNSGDSGRALETRCEAASTWNKPARFRRLCPLLVETQVGLRCSVNAAAVRPFWTRAGASFGIALLALYLAGTLALFGALRAVGYPLTYWSVLLPFKWSDIPSAQEQVYARRAQQALAAGNFQGALLCLNRVHELNPRNYSAAIALASLRHISGEPGLSDQTFEQVLLQHPDRRAQTAQLWYKALLTRRDYSHSKLLAVRMLSEDPANRGAWLHALFFALRQAPDPAYLATLTGRIPDLPAWCSQLMAIELAFQQNRPADAVQLLLRPPPHPASPYVSIYYVDRLTAQARYTEAQQVLDAYAGQLEPDEAAFLRLALYTRRGWLALSESEFDHLLQQFPLNTRTAPQFCAFLIRYPNPALLARFHDRFMQTVRAPGPDFHPTLNALFCACAVNADWSRLEAAAASIKRITMSDARTLTALEGFFRRDYHFKRIDLFLISLPLPTDVVYALLERFGTPPPPS
ncbi:MAG: hypothetical protein PHQ04_04625 [Opitutaceae bacterium]|nr:hypothetical protein [Opitutaceae bacterium]